MMQPDDGPSLGGEPFGALYEPVVSGSDAACPDCPCCTERLCIAARKFAFGGCLHAANRNGLTIEESNALATCPCHSRRASSPPSSRAR